MYPSDGRVPLVDPSRDLYGSEKHFRRVHGSFGLRVGVLVVA